MGSRLNVRQTVKNGHIPMRVRRRQIFNIYALNITYERESIVKYLSAITFAVSLGLSALVSASTTAMKVGPKSPDQMVAVPFNNMMAVEEGGQILFISGDGRFVIRGELVSILYKKTLPTIESIRRATTVVDWKQAGVQLDKLNSVSIGTGPEVVVFVDPLCKNCHGVIEAAEKLKDKYKFTFVVVPALGDQSNILAKKFGCETDRAAALNFLMSNKLDTLPAPTCPQNSYDMSLMVAQLVGVNGVPFLVAPGGQMLRGAPSNLSLWLESVR